MPRLQLNSVEFSVDPGAGTCSANVQLSLGRHEFVGRFEASDEEEPMRAIAKATFDGANRALMANVGKQLEISLRVAEEMRPLFMDMPMFIVIVDIIVGERTLKPAGAVIAEHDDCYYATAAASLDAINRIFEHLLNLYSY